MDLPAGFLWDGPAPTPEGFTGTRITVNAAPQQPPVTLPDGFQWDAAPQSITDKLTGTNGERYQTWPERLVRGIGSSIASGVTLPHDVMTGQAQLPSSGAVPGSVPFGDSNSSGQRVADLAFLANPVNPAVRAGDLALPGMQRAIAPEATGTPTIQALKDAAHTGYQSPEVKGLSIKPTSIAEFSQGAQSKLAQEGFDDSVAPVTFKILGKLEKAPEGAAVTGDNLNSLRKVLGRAAQSADKTEAAAASRAIAVFDEYSANIASKDVIAGDAAAASKTLGTARDNWSAAMRAQTVDRKMIQAELRAAAANSGQNVANTVRQRLADILIKPELQGGYTKAELAQMEGIVRGTAAQNTTRFTGKWLGGGGGLGSLGTSAAGASAGAAVAGPAGAAVGAVVTPAVGFALNALGNKLTLRQAAKLSEMIRSRAPLAKSMEDYGKKASAFQNLSGPKTAAALMLSSRNLSNNLKDAGITMSPADIFKSLQGPMKSAADNEQPNP